MVLSCSNANASPDVCQRRGALIDPSIEVTRVRLQSSSAQRKPAAHECKVAPVGVSVSPDEHSVAAERRQRKRVEIADASTGGHALLGPVQDVQSHLEMWRRIVVRIDEGAPLVGAGRERNSLSHAVEEAPVDAVRTAPEFDLGAIEPCPQPDFERALVARQEDRMEGRGAIPSNDEVGVVLMAKAPCDDLAGRAFAKP